MGPSGLLSLRADAWFYEGLYAEVIISRPSATSGNSNSDFGEGAIDE